VAVEVEDRAAAAAEVPRPALPRHARLQALRPAHQNAHVRRAAGALREHRELRFEVWPAPVPGRPQGGEADPRGGVGGGGVTTTPGRGRPYVKMRS